MLRDNRKNQGRGSEKFRHKDQQKKQKNKTTQGDDLEDILKKPDNSGFKKKKYDKASKYSEKPDYIKKKTSQKIGKKTPQDIDYELSGEELSGIDTRLAKIKKIGKQKKSGTSATKKNEGERLNKYLANAGICSRREADKFISAGLVTINGKVVTELGTKVMPGDVVKFNNEKVNPEKKVYILINKPKDCVTTTDDPEGRRTVMDLIKGACEERVYPVGRLDRNTTGLLLLTNDGELAEKLTHPSYNKKKIYHVFLDKPFHPEHMEELLNGIELEDGMIAVDAISYVGNSKFEIGIEIHSGRNRIVRRMMEHLGYEVVKLDRVYYAGLTKLNLPRGKWRFLTQSEIVRLKTGMYE
jgi:23S rRNA pseudouridine2605 synthase